MSSPVKLKAQVIPLARIANHANLRCDAKYRLFWGEIGDTLYRSSKIPCFPIKLATVDHRVKKLKKGELDGEYELIELEDVEARTGNVLTSTKVTAIKSDKLLFGDADVMTTRLRPYLGKTILNDPTRQMAGTTEWIPIKVRLGVMHPLLLKYHLLSAVYVDNAARLLSGKEHPRIQESDILSLKVPFFDEKTRAALVSEVETLESAIASEEKKIKPDQRVIDEILCGEFGFPLSEHRKRQRMRHYIKGLGAISSGFTLRSSSRYHHPDSELVQAFLLNVPHVRLSNCVASPVKLGVTAKKTDFVEDGDAYYVHPGATKRQGVIAIEDCYQVSGEYFEANRRRAGLRPGDVIINRSGEALGKVAYWDSAEPSVFSDFTMRVRLNAETNPRFMWYFFRSVMFQSQIDREIMGASVHNVFPSQVSRMLVVKCDRKQQDQLASRITAELDSVHVARAAIEGKRWQIQDLFETAVAGKAIP